MILNTGQDMAMAAVRGARVSRHSQDAKPSGLEWCDDTACGVTWTVDQEAAVVRRLNAMTRKNSKGVAGCTWEGMVYG